MKSFGHDLVVGARWEAILSASDSMLSNPVSASSFIIIVFNQQCQNPRATEIIIDRQIVFFFIQT